MTQEGENEITYNEITTMQKCPVCGGHRIVPHGFYAYPAGQSFGSTSTTPEPCRSCDGTGIVEFTASLEKPTRAELASERDQLREALEEIRDIAEEVRPVASARRAIAAISRQAISPPTSGEKAV